MLYSRTWSTCVALVALIASAATPINAQASSSTTSVSFTSKIPAVPTARPTPAPYLASCPAELELQIGICLDTVARDGAVLPCNPDDWWCNCNNWQGILSCYEPCPNLQEQSDFEWQQKNCQGQHGYKNLFGGNSTGTYLGSNITTTGSNGVTRTYYSDMPETASAKVTSTWSWAPASTGSSQQQQAKSSAAQHYAMPVGLLASSLVLVGAANILLL